MPTRRDLIVLGGGPAGTSAALAARQRGLDVVLVEARQRSARDLSLGALADELAARPLRLAPIDRRSVGFRQAVRRAGEVAAAAIDQRDQLLSRRGVERLGGRATFPGDAGVVTVEAGGERTILHARHVLVATGAHPTLPDATARVEDDRSQLLDEREPPASALVVGGGREGVLLAGLLGGAGTEVTLIDAGERLLRFADVDVSAAVKRGLESAGVRVLLRTRVSAIELDADGLRRAVGADARPAQRVYLAGGRTPDLTSFGLDLSAHVTLPLPPQRYDTGLPWLWIAGGASGRAPSPEAARREGRAVVAVAFGGRAHVPYDVIPQVVGGPASAGWTGMTEAHAVARGHSVIIGRARLAGRGPLQPGFLKLIADRGSQRLLGVHVVGAGSREVVALGAALLELGASRSDLAAMAFSGGSPAEALVEAASSAT